MKSSVAMSPILQHIGLSRHLWKSLFTVSADGDNVKVPFVVASGDVGMVAVGIDWVGKLIFHGS